ncbi:hypothetical protein JW992_06040 [candidate division KSB1 bacterium]|nr:hypothetical protein [candidate division KSB1 bacterium]
MRLLLALLIGWLVLATTGCRDQSTRPTKDVPLPSLLPSPPDMALDERGIDAIAEIDAIQLQWEYDERLDRVRLYRRAADEDDFQALAEVKAADTLFIDSTVLLNKRYFYTAVGLDVSNNRSPASDTLDYQLVAKAVNLRISTITSLLFHWQLPEILPDRYVLKLYDDENDTPIWFSSIQSSYSGLEEEVVYNWDGTSNSDRLESRRRYRWRVDIVGSSIRSGSESNWHRFIFP